MTDLRTAAQQALELLERLHGGCTDSDDGTVEAITVWCPEIIEALKAALAEPCPCGDRPADQCPGEWEPGCDLGNNPKYAKRVEMTPKELAASIKRGEKWKVAEPVQEPVAWRTFDGEGGYDYRTYEDNESYAAEWEKRNPRHVGWVEPLYTAPPQRKPLTEEEIMQCFVEAVADYVDVSDAEMVDFARAIERAHGII